MLLSGWAALRNKENHIREVWHSRCTCTVNVNIFNNYVNKIQSLVSWENVFINLFLLHLIIILITFVITFMVAIIVAIMVVIIVIIISRLFKSGSLNLENNEAIENFSMQYATDSDLVKKAIELLLDIKQRKNIWANQRKLNVQERNEKGYDRYNWWELTENGELNKLFLN